MSMVQIRRFIAGIFAILLVILLASLGTAAMGIELPVLTPIANMFGVEVADS